MSILYLIDILRLAPNIQVQGSWWMQSITVVCQWSSSSSETRSENKKQLIRIIVEMLVAEALVPGEYQSRLIITGQEESPVEIDAAGVVIRREDMKITHEEANAIIVAQAIYAAKVEGKCVVVVADDTNVYILLLYHYHSESLKNSHEAAINTDRQSIH